MTSEPFTQRRKSNSSIKILKTSNGAGKNIKMLNTSNEGTEIEDPNSSLRRKSITLTEVDGSSPKSVKILNTSNGGTKKEDSSPSLQKRKSVTIPPLDVKSGGMANTDKSLEVLPDTPPSEDPNSILKEKLRKKMSDKQLLKETNDLINQ